MQHSQSANRNTILVLRSADYREAEAASMWLEAMQGGVAQVL